MYRAFTNFTRPFYMFQLEKRKYLKPILKSLKNGASIVKACEGAGINSMTLWNWRRLNPKLDKLILGIRDSRICEVEDALFDNATKGTPAMPYGNTSAQMYYLKNRSPDRWKDSHFAGSTINAIVFNINSSAGLLNTTEMELLEANAINTG